MKKKNKQTLKNQKDYRLKLQLFPTKEEMFVLTRIGLSDYKTDMRDYAKSRNI